MAATDGIVLKVTNIVLWVIISFTGHHQYQVAEFAFQVPCLAWIQHLQRRRTY